MAYPELIEPAKVKNRYILKKKDMIIELYKEEMEELKKYSMVVDRHGFLFLRRKYNKDFDILKIKLNAIV